MNSNSSPKIAMDVDTHPRGELQQGSHLVYSNNFDDALAFQSYHLMHSPTFQRKRRYLAIASAIVAFLILLLTLSLLPMQQYAVSLSLLGAISIGLYVYLRFIKVSLRKTQKMYEKAPETFNCVHELYVDNQHLVNKTATNESRIELSNSISVKETDKHLFVYTSEMCAHVVPKQKIDVGSIEQFVTSLQRTLPSTYA